MHKVWDKISKAQIAVCILLGVLLAICVVFGKSIEEYGSADFFSASKWCFIAVLALIITVLNLFLFSFLDKITISEKEKSCSRKYWLTCLVLLVIWMPQLIGCYPGFFNYDADIQWLMYINHTISAHHPPLHTWLMGTIVSIVSEITGSMRKGVFAFEIFQLIIFALCFSYVIEYLKSKRNSRVLIAISVAWFSIYPTIIINIISVTKDNFFAAFLSVYLVMTLQLIEQPRERLQNFKFILGYAIITVLTMIMRNNAIYVFILFCPLLFVILKKCWKKMLALFGVTLAIYAFYIVCFCGLVVTEGISTQEYLSVPVQQMMRVYKEKAEELPYETILAYHELFNENAFDYYNPKISDMVKNNVNLDCLEAQKGKYLKLYIELAKQYPDIYIDSFLQNTYGFWYPKATLILSGSGLEGYFQCYSIGWVTNKEPSAIPFIWSYYQMFNRSSLVWGDSFSVIFFAPATFFWLLVYTFAYSIWKKDKANIIVISFVIVLWITYLLGPVALVRYVAFLYYMVPIELCILLGHKKDELK